MKLTFFTKIAYAVKGFFGIDNGWSDTFLIFFFLLFRKKSNYGSLLIRSNKFSSS